MVIKFFSENFPVILEFIYAAIIIKSLSRKSLIPTLYDLFFLIIMFTMSFVLDNSFIQSIFGIAFYLFYVWHISKDKLMDRVSLFCLSYSSIVILNFIIYALFSFFIPTDAWYMAILGNIGCIIFALIVFRFTVCGKLYEFLSQAKLPYRLLLLNSFVCLLCVLIFYKWKPTYFQQNIIYLAIVTMVPLNANVCILYYDRMLFGKQQEVDSYQKNLPRYQALIDEIRASQHEFSNRIQHFQRLPFVCTDYESLRKALLENSSSYCKPLEHYSLLQIDMPLLAATLYSLAVKAEENNVRLIFNIDAFQLKSMAPEYQLADFVSILTQNAMESSQKNAKIYIHISTCENRLQFEIRNPVNQYISPRDVSLFFKKGYTTKKHKKTDNSPHGYGLYSLLQSINKFDGTISAECMEYENQYWIIFCLKV